MFIGLFGVSQRDIIWPLSKEENGVFVVEYGVIVGILIEGYCLAPLKRGHVERIFTYLFCVRTAHLLCSVT